VPFQLPDPLVVDPEGKLRGWSVQWDLEAIAGRYPLAASSDNFRQVPQVRAFHNAVQGIANNVASVLAFGSERYDLGTPSNNMHDGVTNNSRLTCRVAGLYAIVGHVAWAAAAGAGLRQIAILINGATLIAVREDLPGAASIIQEISSQYRLAVGDYAELRVFQNSGAGLNVNTNGNFSPEFMMHWVSP
jgi:hypothetical protein